MKYNGWTNYETWRIALEVFDGFEADDTTEESLREIAEEVILSNVDQRSLAHGLLVTFLSEVNFREIAQNLQSNGNTN